MQRFRSAFRSTYGAWRTLGAIVALGLLAPHRAALSEELSVLEGEIALEQALQTAFLHHPQLRAARAAIAAARGGLLGAKTYPYNPELGASGGTRRESGETQADFAIELSQELELPHKRKKRIAAAEAGLSTTRARFQREARLLAARVHTAFITTLEARDLLQVAEADAELAQRVRDLAKQRLRRGATTQLELNLADAELGRAEGRAKAAEGTYQTARAELAETLGVSPLSPPRASGTLDGSFPPLPPLEELAVTARANRADLLALRAFERQSGAAHELARVSAWPNLTLGAFGAREGERETIIGGGFSIPLPLLQRNQGDIAATRAESARARAQREQGELLALQELATTHAMYRAAMVTAERLRARVFGTLQSNLELLEKAFSAGKTTWPEVLVIRRSLIDAERELIGAEAAARRAWIALELAAGRMPVPAPEEEQKETTP